MNGEHEDKLEELEGICNPIIEKCIRAALAAVLR